LEFIKFRPIELHEKLIILYNEMLGRGEIETTWRHTIFRMIEKKGDLEDPANYRPIAILAIFYKIFAKMLYHRLEEKLDRQQAEDQFGFRSSFRIEEAIGIIEKMISSSNEYNLPLWIASLDLRKAFDRIQYDALFAALREQGLDHAEVALLLDMYSSQSGSVGDSKAF
jgi:hypothetical protein